MRLSRVFIPLALAAAAGAQAAPIQLNYTARFDTCTGGGCTTAIAQSHWAAVSGTYIFDPALVTSTNAPPNGYVPNNFNTSLVHNFTGLNSFSATLQAGGLQARSTGLAFSPSPSSAYNGVGPGSAAAVVTNGDSGRLHDRLQLIDQSMNDITGLPAGWQVGPGLYGGGVTGRLALTFAWGITDPVISGTDIPLDIDSVPGTLSVQAIGFGFFWNRNGGPDTFISYSGRITSFSTQPYVAPPPPPPPPGGPTPPGGTQPVPEPGSLTLAGLALVALLAARAVRPPKAPPADPGLRPASRNGA